jgi:hypothetical protein
VENFEAYFKKQQADSNCGFAEEYEVGGFRYCVFHCFMGNLWGKRWPFWRGQRSLGQCPQMKLRGNLPSSGLDI